MMLLEKSLLVIFALLLVATLVNQILVWRRPNKDWRELTLRIRTWWLIIILFSLALLSPTWLALTFFALLSFMALKEFLTLVPSRHSDRMPLLWIFIAIPINYWLIGIGWYGMFVVFIPVYVFLFLPARMVKKSNLWTISGTACLSFNNRHTEVLLKLGEPETPFLYC